MTRLICSRWMVLGVASSCAALAVPATVQAQPVACGAVLTHSVTLQHDLIDCPAGLNGLVVAANGITIDLNGHTIDGVAGSLDGIDNPNGHDRVTVRDGTIQQFDNGIEMVEASRIQLSRLTIRDNGNLGLNLFGVTQSQVRRSRVLNNDQGGASFAAAGVIESDRNRVEDNSFTDNGAANLASGLLLGGDANRVEENEVRGSATGIVVSADATNTVVHRNRTHDNTVDGVLVEAGSTNTSLTRNRADDNVDDGIHVDSPSATLARNRADDNGDLGIEAIAGVTDGGGNRAQGNGNVLQCVGVVCT